MKNKEGFSQYELLLLRLQSTALLLFKSVFKTICRHSWINKRRKARVVVALLAGLCFCTLGAQAQIKTWNAGTVPSVPPQAVAAGFTTLNFDQEPNQPWDIGFANNGHKWSCAMWWYPWPATDSFSVNSQGILTITDYTGTGGTGTNICTQYYDYSGGTYFQGGYFEAYMSTTDWSAFWLYNAERPFGVTQVATDPLTWTNEIDIIETDPGATFANTATTTIHSNTGSDGGITDQTNPNNNNSISNGPIEGEWHIYGCLWTQTQVTWYVDNVQVCTYPAFASTYQPAQLILGCGNGGVNGSASTVTPPTVQIKWVRVWERPGYTNPDVTPPPTHRHKR